jgi:hypothetical protein
VLGAAATLRTPTDAEVATIFDPSTGRCEWRVRRDQCELTSGHGAEIVGRRVTVYWEEDKKWYDGTVKVYKPADESADGAHVVGYDDGDEEEEQLHFVRTRWRFLEELSSPTVKRPHPERRGCGCVRVVQFVRACGVPGTVRGSHAVRSPALGRRFVGRVLGRLTPIARALCDVPTCDKRGTISGPLCVEKSRIWWLRRRSTVGFRSNS